MRVEPDPYFRREGFDVYTDAYLTISQVSHSLRIGKKLIFLFPMIGGVGDENKGEDIRW